MTTRSNLYAVGVMHYPMFTPGTTMNESARPLRIRVLDLEDDLTVQAIFRLQQSAYQVEADLIQFSALPPLRETPEEIRRRSGTFLGCGVNKELAGIIAFLRHQDRLEITTLAVDLSYFRQGLATSMLRAVEDEARALGRHTLTVSTGALNHPATSFYRKHGFHMLNEVTLPEGVTIASFQRHL